MENLRKRIKKILDRHTLTTYNGGREVEKNNEPIAIEIAELFAEYQKEIHEIAKQNMKLGHPYLDHD